MNVSKLAHQNVSQTGEKCNQFLFEIELEIFIQYLPVIGSSDSFTNFVTTYLRIYENECCYLHQQCYKRKDTHTVYCKKKS